MERIAFEYRKDEPFRVVKDGCVGTIRCMEGGGVSKYIMEVKVIGDLFEDNGHGSMAGRVYDTDGQCPALGASHFQQIKYILDKKNVDEVKELGFMDNGTQQIKVLTEQSIVAMRGRNPENPSDRTVGAPTEQRLEPNSQGICNTLTSVQKDNLVMERKCISTKGKENDVSSTILSGYERSNMTGFNADNAVCENVYDFYNNKLKSDGVCGTLTTRGNTNFSSCGTFGIIEPQYRIRKLTPRECYRLMAVPEKDIDKMLEVNSNTQCYKQAGNSIVVNCLIAIFSQMGIQGIPRWNEGLSEKYK